jgi:hypothetical protein
MGGNMKNTLGVLLLVAWLGMLPVTGCVQSALAEAPQRSSNSYLNEMLSEGLGYPPYRMEIWVESVQGLPAKGTKDLLEDCVRENLRALGNLEFVDSMGTEKRPPVLRLRIWFTQSERPDDYECFDTTLVVVVGNIMKENQRYEAVLDTYALAGVAERDVDDMCRKIATRFDLKIISLLPENRQRSKQP